MMDVCSLCVGMRVLIKTLEEYPNARYWSRESREICGRVVTISKVLESGGFFKAGNAKFIYARDIIKEIVSGYADPNDMDSIDSLMDLF